MRDILTWDEFGKAMRQHFGASLDHLRVVDDGDGHGNFITFQVISAEEFARLTNIQAFVDAVKAL